jgi:hypothetical protein
VLLQFLVSNECIDRHNNLPVVILDAPSFIFCSGLGAFLRLRHHEPPVEHATSTSQHSHLLIVPGIARQEEPETADRGYEPMIALKAVAKILDCSAEQRRAPGRGQEDPCLSSRLSLEIHRFGHCQVARTAA